MADLGVDVIEAGFGDSDEGTEAIALLAKRFSKTGPRVSGLVSASGPRERVKATVEAVAPARKPRVHLYADTGELTDGAGRLRPDAGRALDKALAAVEYVRRRGCEVEFSPPRTSLEAVEIAAGWTRAAIDAGAQTINFRSNSGCERPEDYLALLAELRRLAPPPRDVTVSADPFAQHARGSGALNQATASAEAALEVGCRQVKCAFHGIAATPGHPSLELLAFQIWLRGRLRESRLWTGVDTARLVATSEVVAAAKGLEVPPSQPLVGKETIAPSPAELPDDPIERVLVATATRLVLSGLGLSIPLWLEEAAVPADPAQFAHTVNEERR
jgi:2-isopropylmalate synthase